MQNRIFSFDSAKAIKAQSFGYLNAIQYMAPYTLAGVGNLCSHSIDPCRIPCLGVTSGQAGMVRNAKSAKPQGNSVRKSRNAKARRFMRERAAYLLDYVRSVDNAIKRAEREGKKLAIRPNGSTDIAYEGIRFTIERNAKGKAIKVVLGGAAGKNIAEHYPHIPHIDYTKNPNRFKRPLPANYHLTFSFSGQNQPDCLELLSRGHNVAVIFAAHHGKGRPTMWNGYPVINGDEHDLRHLDPRGVVVGLSPKGRVILEDTSGFLVRT